MKRFLLLLLVLLLPLLTLAAGEARAHSESTQSQYSGDVLSPGASRTGLIITVAADQKEHGGDADRCGVCAECCAAACSPFAVLSLSDAPPEIATSPHVLLTLLSQRHGRDLSPPSPPPRA